MIAPHVAQIKSSCGKNPNRDKSLYEHRLLYSQNKINAFQFEEGEIKLRKAQREYPLCEYHVLKQAGVYGDEKRLFEFFINSMKALGMKTQCYNIEGVSFLACQMAGYFIGGAAAGKAAASIQKMTGMKLAQLKERKVLKKLSQSGPLEELELENDVRMEAHLANHSNRVLPTARTAGIQFSPLDKGSFSRQAIGGRLTPIYSRTYLVQVKTSKGVQKFKFVILSDKNIEETKKALEKAKEVIESLPADSYEGLDTLNWSLILPDNIRYSVNGPYRIFEPFFSSL